MDNNPLATAVKFLALGQDAQRSRLARVEAITIGGTRRQPVLLWIDILGAVVDTELGMRELSLSTPGQADGRQLVLEWKCFARRFRKFLLDMGSYTADEPDGVDAVHELSAR